MNGRGDVVAVGEVLWDIFGEDRHLGGAPFNFAVHCHHLGATSAIVSRVGDDDLGEEILARARALGIDAELIQVDPEHPTGQVQVTLDDEGVPTFNICTGVAYDFIETEPAALDRLAETDIVCFGTLAQREAVSRQSIADLLEAASAALIVCDLNLRPPHYSERTVRRSLEYADVLKLNDDELRICKWMHDREEEEDRAFLRFLLQTYGMELICVTLGPRGCVLCTADEWAASPGYQVEVEDTVGSGDAFTAGLVMKYLADWPLREVANYANLVGAYVATQPGATPPITEEDLEVLADRAERIGGTLQEG